MRTGIVFILLLVQVHARAQAWRNDVVIDEIMADPTPTKGLPNDEFVELKNTSRTAWNLRNWKFADATGMATITINFVLQPDSMVILCSTAAAARLQVFGNVIGVSSFPSLDNEGEWLSLRAPDGRLVHVVSYSKSWYGNAVKEDGGWTLEMIDPHSACSGASNWTASLNPAGGTPGKRNSVDAVNPDSRPPSPVHSYAPDPYSIMIQFDEPLDSAVAAHPEQYGISDGIGQPASAIVMPPLFSVVKLSLNKPLAQGKTYGVTVKGIPDCAGNGSGNIEVKTGRAGEAQSGDVVFNEILFNPRPAGTDYIELYNRGSGIFDLAALSMANRTGSNSLVNIHPFPAESRLLFPGEYWVITEDGAAVRHDYPLLNLDHVLEIPAMPSLPDDKGTVVLLTTSGVVIDELRYDVKWQFPLIDNPEGVALERIDFNKPTQDATNWHSAASTAGYGTPGYPNSQFRQATLLDPGWKVQPRLFSPDNDGFNDVAELTYRLPEPGWVCNITVYNDQAVPVRWLARNNLCSASGSFRWDGLDEKGHKLAMGVYIFLVQLFDLKGHTATIRKAVTLVRRMN